METTLAPKTDKNTWAGGSKPWAVSYGKMMMWFFIVSDALTFMGFLVAYGFTRFKFLHAWPVADEVFTHFPFLEGDYPMLYVALMTFILIMSSVTMVLAVHYGHKNDQSKVTTYMLLTVIGGFIFLGSQAWEWGHFIHGSHGAIKLNDTSIVHVVDAEGHKVSIPEMLGMDPHGDFGTIALSDVESAFAKHPEYSLRKETLEVVPHAAAGEVFDDASKVVTGANLIENEYGNPLFGNFFFFITGFHGFHVFTGVLINIIIFFNVLLGTYRRRESYEMVEKVGLYWHFVDLVWVFVFTFFYLI